MAISSKIVKVDQVKDIAEDYTKGLNGKVDKVEGSGLYPDADKTKLAGIEAQAQKNNITKVVVNDQEQTILDGTLTIDVETIIQGDGFVTDTELEGYLKKSEIETELGSYATDAEVETKLQGYVPQEGFDAKVKTAVGSVYVPKGSLENFEAIKAVESPTVGDVYNATDTGANYVYVGPEQGDEGWDKLSETVDLSGYATTESLGSYATKSDLATKADQTALDEKANQTDLEALQGTVGGKLAESDLVFATQDEVLAAIAAGKEAANAPTEPGGEDGA